MITTSNRSYSSCVAFLLIMIGSVILWIGIGLIYDYYNNLGAFSSWKTLASNNIRFDRIIDANTYALLAEGIDGKVYYRDHACMFKDTCDQWVSGNGVVLENWSELIVSRRTTCNFETHRYFKPPAQETSECIEVIDDEYKMGDDTYYALLKNGNILVNVISNNLYFDLGVIFLSIIIGAVFGILIFLTSTFISKNTKVTSET